ncbi:oxysterol binding protein [Limtongia smithiae]|uniref:oxysterol binding protein n=1 Tax=Limtongia smithiae TaxID=1125753 RepID=UPI0034CF018F
MESIEVHSKDFAIRWITVPDHASVRWQLAPNKKSINFGIFRKCRPHEPRPATTATLDDRLANSALTPVYWHGRCHPNAIVKGSYSVPAGAGGVFGFLFDNTFSKTLSKTVQFAHSVVPPDTTNPSNVTPATTTTTTTTRRPRRGTGVSRRNAKESELLDRPSQSSDGSSKADTVDDRFHGGVLLKKRRKRLQGYAKRYFALDADAGMLSYYHDVTSSLLRGSIPLALAAVSVKPQTREIFIDSGAEIWNLRAPSQDEFEGWQAALTRARTVALTVIPDALVARASLAAGTVSIASTTATPYATTRRVDAHMMEALGSKLNAALALSQKLASETSSTSSSFSSLAPSLQPTPVQTPPLHTNHHQGNGTRTAASASSTVNSATSSDQLSTSAPKRQPFWQKRSNPKESFPTLASFENNTAQPSKPYSSPPPLPLPLIGSQFTMALELQQLLDQLLKDYTTIMHTAITHTRTLSDMIRPLSPTIDQKLEDATLAAHDEEDNGSILSDSEFFDAAENPPIFVLPDNNNGDAPEDIVVVFDDEEVDARSSSSLRRMSATSSVSSDSIVLAALTSNANTQVDLYPLPITTPISRREIVPKAKVPPPSLIQFVRKNVGKDLSTVTMPVTANEPLSLLQRYAEVLEYSSLLDTASKSSVASGEQMMYVAAFAVSTLANNRSNARALRKPFNPLLNETYELVREDMGFRFLSEKVSHRPPVMATFAESQQWSYSFCPQPSQKFWGKSAEIIIEGQVRVSIFGDPGEVGTPSITPVVYTYSMPTTYLRNMLAGEKYIEPVGQMIVSASSGHRAVIEFKSKSIFSGQRVDEVTVKIFKPSTTDGCIERVSMHGRWTSELLRDSDNSEVWRVGSLMPDQAARYGMSTFSASLNDITILEKDNNVPPTDSRFRPDQRALENGNIDEAEQLKHMVEETQRERRRHGEIPTEGASSVWFERVEDDVWVPVRGKNGYWERRRRRDWEGVPELW